MILTYKEILKLKGCKLLDTVTCGLEKVFTVTSVTKRNIVLNNGLTYKTDQFYESKQANYELVKPKAPKHTFNQVSPEKWALIVSKLDRLTTHEKGGVIHELLYNEASRHVATYNPKLKRVYTDGGRDIIELINNLK
jgi:hypothetical protein